VVRGADGGTRGGDAFFRDLTFAIGARQMTLDQIEGEVIRGTFQDARIHFAINCGSKSCPVLKPQAFTGRDLQGQLDEATRAFVNDGRNVVVDPARKAVRLSVLFEWYAGDFARFAQEKGQRPDALGFLALYAAPPLAKALALARKQKFAVEFLPYDWTVNSAPVAAASALGVGKPAQDFACALPGGGTRCCSSTSGPPGASPVAPPFPGSPRSTRSTGTRASR
jgi:hypothetical protein